MSNYNLQTLFNACVIKYEQENQLCGDIFDTQLSAMLLVLYASIYKDYMKQKRIAQKNGFSLEQENVIFVDENIKEDFTQNINKEISRESNAFDTYKEYMQALHENMICIVHLIDNLFNTGEYNSKLIALNIAENYRINEKFFDEGEIAYEEFINSLKDIPLSVLKDIENELKVYNLQHLMKKPINLKKAMNQKNKEKKET